MVDKYQQLINENSKLYSAIEELAKKNRKLNPERQCVWRVVYEKYSGDDGYGLRTYKTQCGKETVYGFDTEGMTHCCYCGGRLIERASDDGLG